jgi:tetratricopeptide (TPR) repeat protein
VNPVQAILWTEASGAGRLALEQGDLETAEERLTAALQMAERDGASHADSLFYLARLRLAQHRLDEAEALDREALALRDALRHPEAALSCLVLALFYPRPEPAVIPRALEEGVRRFGPHSWQAARLFAHAGRYDEAREACAKAPEAAVWCARLAQERGHYEAVALFRGVHDHIGYGIDEEDVAT